MLLTPQGNVTPLLTCHSPLSHPSWISPPSSDLSPLPTPHPPQCAATAAAKYLACQISCSFLFLEWDSGSVQRHTASSSPPLPRRAQGTHTRRQISAAQSYTFRCAENRLDSISTFSLSVCGVLSTQELSALTKSCSAFVYCSWRYVVGWKTGSVRTRRKQWRSKVSFLFCFFFSNLPWHSQNAERFILFFFVISIATWIPPANKKADTLQLNAERCHKIFVEHWLLELAGSETWCLVFGFVG